MSNRRNRLRGIAILHEDADLIVLEKSAGILTQETYRRVGGQGDTAKTICNTG